MAAENGLVSSPCFHWCLIKRSADGEEQFGGLACHLIKTVDKEPADEQNTETDDDLCRQGSPQVGTPQLFAPTRRGPQARNAPARNAPARNAPATFGSRSPGGGRSS